jgi:hypothetical protein
MSDRGTNLIKALQGYQTLFCFPHRMNNVLKRGFFQLRSNRTSTKTSATVPATTSLAPDIGTNDSSDSNSSTDEEEVFKPTKQINKKKRKKESSVTNGNDPMKLKFEDLPVKAQEIIETIKQCKKLVRYIKKVVYFSWV